MNKNTIPPKNKIAYAKKVCDYRLLKSEPHRVRLTVGSGKLKYSQDTSSPVAMLLETNNLLLNSTISESSKGAIFITIDIKHFFVLSDPPEPEYMQIHKKDFSLHFQKEKKIKNVTHVDNYIYCKIQKGMHGIKQAARSYDQLVKRYRAKGYSPDPVATSIWKRITRPTRFCLHVDDFGIKYHSLHNVIYLLITLRK